MTIETPILGTAFTITLESTVPPELVAEVGEKLAYASEHLRRIGLSEDGARIEIELDDPARFDEVGARIQDIVRALVRGYRELPDRPLWRHVAEPAYRASVWEDLQALGLMSSPGPGCVTLLGDACRVAEGLDRMFAAIARDVFDAVPHQYPVLIPRAALERCDYFASFPHHVTFAPHLRESVEAITAVANASSETRGGAIADALVTPTHVLSPSVCFHTYLLLADREIDAPVVITAVNRCFRWESINFATCERLWDFSMREIVFVGDAEWVEARRAEALGEVERLVERLALDAWIETANDPFFVTRFAAKRYFQRLTHAKFELRLSLPYSGASVAVASFNVHHDFFGRAYGVRRGEGFASTGCVGFGLERWVWALFAQNGPRIASWPTGVRRALGV